MVEVLIFLAISSFLLVVSITFLSGREDQNRFAQSMRNVQSKFQDWVNDVSTGYPGATSGNTGLSSLRCDIPSGNGRINVKAVGLSSRTPDCIFLGKAIQVTTAASPPSSGQEAKIYAYSVFGRRTLTVGGEERLVNNLVEAVPVPVVGIPAVSGSSVDFTEVYNLGGGATVKSVTSKALNSSGGVVSGASRMAGFYLSFNQLAANKNGSQNLKSYIYNLQTDTLPGTSNTTVDDCISMAVGSCAKSPLSTPDDQWPQALQEWDICFQSSGKNQTALLTVSSTNGSGASTKLQFTAC